MAKPALYYDNRFDDGTPAASTTAAGYAVANLFDWRPYTWWKPTAVPATVTVDCGSAQAADYLLVYGEAGTYEARGSTDNFAASDELLGTVTLTELGLGLVTFNASSYRYHRLKITAGSAPAVAIAAIGAALELPTWLPQGFDPVGRKVVGSANTNANGQPLGRVVDYEAWSQEVRLQSVTWAWLRATLLPAWRAHLRGSPFGFCWDPVSYADEVRLVVADGDLDAPHSAGSRTDVSFKISGVVE